MNRKHIIITLLLLFAASKTVPCQHSVFPTEKLKEYYKKLLADYNVPGMSAVVIINNTTVLQDGFGKLSIKNEHPVNDQTLFGIASLSKTFTAAMVANAVKDKKFTYNTPIVDLMPWFKLYDPYVTSKITIADALSHRSGLNNFSGDLIWYGSNINDSIIIHRMRHLQAKYGFRTHFGYSNIMYLLIGELLEKQYNQPFDNILNNLILKPLSTKYTTASFNEAMHHFNLAIPHIEVNGKVQIQPHISWDNMKPAGGMFSNAEEMGKYIKMWLNNGFKNNTEIVPTKEIQYLWRQHTPKQLSWLDKQMNTPVNFKSYGLGWEMMNYNGAKIFSHSGGLDGMVCQMVLVPEQKIGAVFMANKTTALPMVLMYDLLDKYVGTNDKNYPQKLLALLKKNKETTAKNNDIKLQTEKTDLTFFQGEYVDSLVGKAIIYAKKGSLFISWKESDIFEGTLEQTDLLKFNLTWLKVPSLPQGILNFEVNGIGQIKGFTIDLPNPDLHFNELHFVKKNQ